MRVVGFLDFLKGGNTPKRPSWADDKNAQQAFSETLLRATRKLNIPDVFVGATLNLANTRPLLDARLAEMEASGESREAQASATADNFLTLWRKMSDQERDKFLALKSREQGGKWGN